MNRWKKAEKLSELIMKFGGGKIDKDTADLVAYRYFSKKTFWDMIKPDHTSLSQIANGYVIGLKNDGKVIPDDTITFSVDGREVTLRKDLVERYSETVCPVGKEYLQCMIHVFGKNCDDDKVMSAKISIDMEEELREYGGSVVDELYGIASNISMTLDEIRDERLSKQ